MSFPFHSIADAVSYNAKRRPNHPAFINLDFVFAQSKTKFTSTNNNKLADKIAIAAEN